MRTEPLRVTAPRRVLTIGALVAIGAATTAVAVADTPSVDQQIHACVSRGLIGIGAGSIRIVSDTTAIACRFSFPNHAIERRYGNFKRLH